MNENNMVSENIGCELVQDLIPLYIDDVCSDTSRAMVEKHLTECEACSQMVEKLRNSEQETALKSESEDVVYKFAKKEKRKSAVVGIVFASVLMIPVIVCMIVNLAVGHSLDWFFIVLTSLMVLASLTVTPLIAYRNKLLWTIGCFTGSLLILLATVCIFCHGNWFFLVASCVIFGIAVCFMPVVAHAIKKGFFANHKGLFVIGADTLLFLNMMITIGIHVKSSLYFSISWPIILVVLVFIWGILLFARYIKATKPFKAGLIVAWCGLFCALGDKFVFSLMGYSVVYHAFHPLNWRGANLSSNINWVTLIICLVIGVSLVIKGSRLGEKK